MSIIQTVLKNHEGKYSQGDFANGLSRVNLYNEAQNINGNNDSLKNFLYNTLMWGDFNTVVGRYKNTNALEVINNIHNFDNYASSFFEILNDEQLSIEQKFNYFKKGKLKIKNVGFAYFTKFLHFYSVGKNLNKKVLILDKWLIYTWTAIILENEMRIQYEIIKKLLWVDKINKFKVKDIDGNLYKIYNNTMQEISDDLGLPIQRFEELVFGWDLRIEKLNYTNPRFQILQILNSNLNLFKKAST